MSPPPPPLHSIQPRSVRNILPFTRLESIESEHEELSKPVVTTSSKNQNIRAWARKTFHSKKEVAIVKTGFPRTLRRPSEDDRITVVFPNPKTGVLSPAISPNISPRNSCNLGRDRQRKKKRETPQSRLPSREGAKYKIPAATAPIEIETPVGSSYPPETLVSSQPKPSLKSHSYTNQESQVVISPQRRWSSASKSSLNRIVPSDTDKYPTEHRASMFRSSKHSRRYAGSSTKFPALSPRYAVPGPSFESDEFAVVMPTTREPIMEGSLMYDENALFVSGTPSPSQYSSYEECLQAKIPRSSEDKPVKEEVSRSFNYAELDALPTAISVVHPSKICRPIPRKAVSKPKADCNTDTGSSDPLKLTKTIAKSNGDDGRAETSTTPPPPPPPPHNPPLASWLHLVSSPTTPTWHSPPSGTAVTYKAIPSSSCSSSSSSKSISSPASSTKSELESAATTPPSSPTKPKTVRVYFKPPPIEKDQAFRELSASTTASEHKPTITKIGLSPQKEVVALKTLPEQPHPPQPTFADVVSALSAYLESLIMRVATTSSPLSSSSSSSSQSPTNIKRKPCPSSASPSSSGSPRLPSASASSSPPASHLLYTTNPNAGDLKTAWTAFGAWTAWLVQWVLVIWAAVLLFKILSMLAGAVWAVLWPVRMIVRVLWKVNSR